MQLRLRRSQRTGGMIRQSVVFTLDARAQLTPAEAANVQRYNLGKMVIYSSAAAQKHMNTAMESHSRRTLTGDLKAAMFAVMSKLSLNITIDSLTQGVHIEASDLPELLAAEEAVTEACKTLRTYLDLAATFTGQEQVLEF